MKKFVFLYPIPEIIDFEIKNHGWAEEGGIEVFRQKYKSLLNNCIDFRYRQKDFEINYAVFNGSPVSDVVDLKSSDRIIQVGLDFKTHTTQQANGEYPYPDQDFILNQLGKTEELRVAGFHLWDCVERLAKRAYERGINVLVDEDLTELFAYNISLERDFCPEKYPTFNPRESGSESSFKMFMQARQERPWLWQNY
ncbi:MAG TPA: hypothetical protein VJ438_05155 [Candidatus Nanoarchaeia archaeon]|nr:hypothetical protein [Candidatus Nanoarchaeia archaeon]